VKRFLVPLFVSPPPVPLPHTERWVCACGQLNSQEAKETREPGEHSKEGSCYKERKEELKPSTRIREAKWGDEKGGREEDKGGTEEQGDDIAKSGKVCPACRQERGGGDLGATMRRKEEQAADLCHKLLPSPLPDAMLFVVNIP
jgi:hypothetical protein